MGLNIFKYMQKIYIVQGGNIKESRALYRNIEKPILILVQAPERESIFFISLSIFFFVCETERVEALSRFSFCTPRVLVVMVPCNVNRSQFVYIVNTLKEITLRGGMRSGKETSSLTLHTHSFSLDPSDAFRRAGRSGSRRV